MSYNADEDFDDYDEDVDFGEEIDFEDDFDDKEELDESKTDDEADDDSLDVYGDEADDILEQKDIISEDLYNREITVLEKSVIISKRVLQLTDFRIKRNPKLPDSELKRLGLTELIDIANYEFDNRMDIPILFERSGVLIPVNKVFEYERRQKETLLNRLSKIKEKNVSW